MEGGGHPLNVTCALRCESQNSGTKRKTALLLAVLLLPVPLLVVLLVLLVLLLVLLLVVLPLRVRSRLCRGAARRLICACEERTMPVCASSCQALFT